MKLAKIEDYNHQGLTKSQGRDGFLISTIGPPLTKVCDTLLGNCVFLTLLGADRGPEDIVPRVRREAIAHSRRA
jgi:hypothetical protein